MDTFQDFPPTPISPATGGVLIAPGVNALAQVTRALYIGTGGDVSVQMADGEGLTFEAVPAGSFLPIRVTHVFEPGTSAGGIVALW